MKKLTVSQVDFDDIKTDGTPHPDFARPLPQGARVE